MTTFLKRTLCTVLVASTGLLGFPVLGHSAMVSTDEAMAAEAGQEVAHDARAQVEAFLARADVQLALEQQGVRPDAALARVQAMTDGEVVQLAGRIDQTPAGGDVLGLAFTVFIVLLITDIFGLTKVFPFTRSVR